MPSKYELELENRKLRIDLAYEKQRVEPLLSRQRSDTAKMEGYIRALKALIRIFPQFAAYRRRDAEDDWGTLYSDLIAEDMERIHISRDDARKRRLFGEQTREK